MNHAHFSLEKNIVCNSAVRECSGEVENGGEKAAVVPSTGGFSKEGELAHVTLCWLSTAVRVISLSPSLVVASVARRTRRQEDKSRKVNSSCDD